MRRKTKTSKVNTVGKLRIWRLYILTVASEKCACAYCCTQMYLTDSASCPIKVAAYQENDQERKYVLQKNVLHASQHTVLLYESCNLSSWKWKWTKGFLESQKRLQVNPVQLRRRVVVRAYSLREKILWRHRLVVSKSRRLCNSQPSA